MSTAAPTAPSADWFGSKIDTAHAEILAIGAVDHKLLQPEAKLMTRKWFDYRQLHPVAATYLMAHHYNRAYGDFIGKALSVDRRFTKAFKGGDVMQVHEMRSFWRLRQAIDERGMRYEFFLRRAMDWYIDRGWGKKAPSPPRPAHILNNDELLVDMENAWVLDARAKIHYASSPRFHVSQWVAAPDQLAYQEHLIESIKRRPHPRFALHAALYVVEHLRIEAALENFEERVVAEAIEHCLI